MCVMQGAWNPQQRIRKVRLTGLLCITHSNCHCRISSHFPSLFLSFLFVQFIPLSVTQIFFLTFRFLLCTYNLCFLSLSSLLDTQKLYRILLGISLVCGWDIQYVEREWVWENAGRFENKKRNERTNERSGEKKEKEKQK